MFRNILIFLFIVLCLFSTCKSDDNHKAQAIKNKVVVEIPKEFRNDTIISNHLLKLSNNLEDFSQVIENIADGIDAIGIKDIRKPSVFEKLQLMKILLPKVEPAMKQIRNIQQLDVISERIKDTLPSEKKKSFMAFEDKFKKKFDALYNRFSQYMKNDN